MGRIGLAFKTFFGILFNKAVAERIARAAVAEETPPALLPAVVTPPPPPPPAPAKPTRSDALTLLESLQREARFIDFIQESLDGFDDAQVGAAVRDVHRGSQAVLTRFFQLRPVLSQPEGSQFTVTATEPAGRLRLTGKVSEQRPVSGEIVHCGWQAEQCDLPKWNGSDATRLIIAPAEIELRG